MKHIISILILSAAQLVAQFATPLLVMPTPSGTSGAQIRLREAGNNGTDYFAFRAAANMPAPLLYDLPPIDGTAGQVLSTNGGQVLSWTSVAGNTIPVCTSTTGSDTYTCTVAGFTSYSTNYCIVLSVDFANVGTATLDISSVGPQSILRYGGSALVTNDILANSPVLICYDGTQFTLPPSASPGSGAFLDGGNTFGSHAFLGTNDNFSLAIETNGIHRWTFSPSGHLQAAIDDTYFIGGGVSGGVWINNPSAIYATSALISKKLTLYDNTGSIAVPGSWDLNAVASGVGASAMSNFYLRNNAGANMLKIEAVNGGGTVDRSIFSTDVISDAANTRKVGTAAVPWSQMHSRSAYHQFLNVSTAAFAGGVLRDPNGTGDAQWGYPDEYDVRNYGAVCDAVTDDTIPIQLAINAAVNVKGIVVLPQGNCKVTTLDINTSFRGIRGSGTYATRLFSVTDAPIIHVITTETDPMTMVDTPRFFYFLDFWDFSLVGDSVSPNQAGIKIDGIGSWGVSTVRNVYFTGLAYGIEMRTTDNQNSSHIKIINNWFSMGTPNAVSIYRNTPGSGWMVDGNHFAGPAGAIGDTSGPRAIIMRGVTGDTMINNNHIEGGWLAMDLSCDDGLTPVSISAATNANPAVLTVIGHGRTGTIDVSVNNFRGSWLGINRVWAGTVIDADHISIPADTTLLGAISGEPEITSSGVCVYGANFVSIANKIDGYTFDYRMYNINKSAFTSNRGRGIQLADVRGYTGGNSYDVFGYGDTGTDERSGLLFHTDHGSLALNAYDTGRIRIGETTADISNTRDGISILDTAQSSSFALGQSGTANMGMLWSYNATPANAFGLLYSYGANNELRYVAKNHEFYGGWLSTSLSAPIVPEAPLHVSDASGSIIVDAYNAAGAPNIIFRHANGVLGAPTATLAGNRLMNIGAQGHTGSARQTGARIGMFAGSNFTGSNAESYIMFSAVPAGSTTVTPYWRISSDGHWRPETNGASDFGTPSFRPKDLYLSGFSDINGAYKTGGTTVIDSSRNLVGINTVSQDLLFPFFNVLSIGNSAATQSPLNIYGRYVEPQTELVLGSGVNVRGDLDPAVANSQFIGGPFTRWAGAYINNLYLYGAVQAPSGLTGASFNLTCPAGQAVKNLRVDAGIVLSGSCGAP